MVNQLIGRGISRAEAEQEAKASIEGAVAEKMGEGALPGWAEMLLGVAGGIGGWAAGAKLAAKGVAKALAKEGVTKAATAPARVVAESTEAAADNVKGLPFSGGTYRGKAPAEARKLRLRYKRRSVAPQHLNQRTT